MKEKRYMYSYQCYIRHKSKVIKKIENKKWTQMVPIQELFYRKVQGKIASFKYEF